MTVLCTCFSLQTIATQMTDKSQNREREAMSELACTEIDIVGGMVFILEINRY